MNGPVEIAYRRKCFEVNSLIVVLVVSWVFFFFIVVFLAAYLTLWISVNIQPPDPSDQFVPLGSQLSFEAGRIATTRADILAGGPIVCNIFDGCFNRAWSAPHPLIYNLTAPASDPVFIRCLHDRLMHINPSTCSIHIAETVHSARDVQDALDGVAFANSFHEFVCKIAFMFFELFYNVSGSVLSNWLVCYFILYALVAGGFLCMLAWPAHFQKQWFDLLRLARNTLKKIDGWLAARRSGADLVLLLPYAYDVDNEKAFWVDWRDFIKAKIDLSALNSDHVRLVQCADGFVFLPAGPEFVGKENDGTYYSYDDIRSILAKNK